MPPPPQRLATKDMYSFKQGKTILTDEQTDIHILYLADITVFCTSCNSIQPGHVNASTSPEAGHEGHGVVGFTHLTTNINSERKEG